MAIRRLPGLPSVVTIARFWCEKDTFVNLQWNRPGCFACGYLPLRVSTSLSFENQWRAARLQRCHLISAADKGSPQVHNLVLLCSRCHKQAPMTAASPQPMIDWINRRQGYAEYFIESFLKECQNISPTLLEDLATPGWASAEELAADIRAMIAFMKVGGNHRDHMFASMAAVFNGLLQLRSVYQRVQKSVDGKAPG